MNLQWILEPSVVHLAIILSAFFITYARIFGKDFFWVIDDLDGIAKYSETWSEAEQRKIDSYEFEGKQVKNLAFNPAIGFPGNVFRFLRLNIGKRHQVIGKNAKGHDVYGFKQCPRRHHAINVTVQALNLIMAYFFMRLFAPDWVAFGATLLYAVHPLTTASVAWISGYNYNFSMFFSLALMYVSMTCQIPQIKYILIAVLSFMATMTIYTGAFSFLPMLLLGLHTEALVAGVVGISLILWKGLEVKDFRIKAFKEQNMGGTTFFHPRKPIVMIKTLWYYMRSVFLPIKMGLYHPWGYFYEEPIERFDRMFWFGVATLLLFGCGFYFGDLVVRFGIVWFFAFFFLFSNFITAQQFIADRYVMVPSFGICIILTQIFYGTPIFWVILGLYAMRTFLHLSTYRNEIDFYLSNWLNFRKSEVALGNLGVAYVNQGMHGAAVDTWKLATQVNPLYDVPWYNLYSVFKGHGQLEMARDFLKNCLNAKVVHFEKKWGDELIELEKHIEFQKNPVKPTELNYHEAADHYKNGSTQLEIECLKKYLEGDTTGLIPEMTEQVKQRLAELDTQNLGSHPLPQSKGPASSRPDSVDQGTGLPPTQN